LLPGQTGHFRIFLERSVEMSDCEALCYSSFYEWFTPAYVGQRRLRDIFGGVPSIVTFTE
jgi:hypothetical protein